MALSRDQPHHGSPVWGHGGLTQTGPPALAGTPAISSVLSPLLKKQLLNVGCITHEQSVVQAHYSLNTFLQMYLATRQSNAMCLISSGSLQCGHSVLALLPRSLVPTRSAWLHSSHMNPLILEDAKVDRCSCLTLLRLMP
jgi:hypothetical protein